jgi:hypothetical protein
MGESKIKKLKKLKSLFKGKVPDGIIPELGLTEETRDRLNKRDWSGPLRRELKDKNPNTLTTKELQEIKFSGIRHNEFNNMCEIWVDGIVKAEANADKVTKDPTILAEMHERVFQTVGSLIDIEPIRRTNDKG